MKASEVTPPTADTIAVEQRMKTVAIERVQRDGCELMSDQLAIEEPLEIRLACSQEGKLTQRSISITMRTPGHDRELACGFLFSEGIIRHADDIAGVRPCGPPVGPLKLHNVVRVTLRSGANVDLARLERHFYTSSSCGVCGKASIAALAVVGVEPLVVDDFSVAASLLCDLPTRLRRAQDVFEQTGGLHAAGLFSRAGTLSDLREDVGRHNAVDKLIGAALLAGRVPLHDQILVLSGRASFELVQKALVARIPIIAAVGAPSSLAVELAEHNGITLVGFIRDQRLNIYSHPTRVARHVST